MDEKKCDLCKQPAKYDAKLVMGPWAYVCQSCFDESATGTDGSYTELALIGTPGREPYAPTPPKDGYHSGVDQLLAIPYEDEQ